MAVSPTELSSQGMNLMVRSPSSKQAAVQCSVQTSLTRTSRSQTTPGACGPGWHLPDEHKSWHISQGTAALEAPNIESTPFWCMLRLLLGHAVAGPRVLFRSAATDVIDTATQNEDRAGGANSQPEKLQRQQAACHLLRWRSRSSKVALLQSCPIPSVKLSLHVVN